MAYLYRHIRLDNNEPFYIGISATDDNYARAYDKSHKHRRNKLWQNITNKTDFEVEILLDNLTHEESCEKEKEFIKLYGRKDLGTGTLCNYTDGGDEGTLGRKYIYSDEHRKKTGEAVKKVYQREGQREKFALTRTFTRLSQETKDKIRESKKNLIHKKRNCTCYRPAMEVHQFSLDGELVATYKSVNAASKIGYSSASISKVCRGLSHYHRGFKWKYKKDLI
jgi:hypothetical protein